jgi:hypothetical protein
MSVGLGDSMVAVLHGRMRGHTWRTSAAESDTYSLFTARASAMGWQTEPELHPSSGLWGMNDAESSDDVARFQVALPSTIPSTSPLPVQPLLACARDVLGRLGTFDLSIAEVRLPMQIMTARSRIQALGTLLHAAGWFVDLAPASAVSVRVNVHSDVSGALPNGLTAGFARRVSAIQQRVLRDAEPVEDKETLSFAATLAEWSPDALGWTVAFLAEVFHEFGVRTPVVVAATRV